MSTTAGDLVRAFGDVDTMQTMYTEDISWTLPASLGPLAGPHIGKDAVTAFSRTAWGTLYEPEGVEVEVLDELEEGDLSAARFLYRATVAASGEAYENSYTIFVRTRDGKVAEVHELVDTLKVAHYAGFRPMLPPIPA
jgi:ketosteroid isomerase-like protein